MVVVGPELPDLEPEVSAHVADIGPVGAAQRLLVSRDELAGVVARHQADAGLTADLDALAGSTTDELDPA